jgi:hypothetical protein
MDPVGLALILAGIAAIAVGAFKIRGPLATIRRLDAADANHRRYETWRGRDTSVQADGPTGADEMRTLMRQRAMLWGGLAIGGAVAVVGGLLIW